MANWEDFQGAKWDDFEEIKETPKTKTKKNIDVTPSGLFNNTVDTILAGIETPVRMAKGDDIKTAFDNSLNAQKEFRQEFKEKHPVLGKVNDLQDFTVDMLGYGKLPIVSKYGKVGNFLGNAAIQGGVTGAAETMKRGGNGAVGAGQGTLLAGLIQGALPPAIKGVGKGLEKAANSEIIKKTLPST